MESSEIHFCYRYSTCDDFCGINFDDISDWATNNARSKINCTLA